MKLLLELTRIANLKRISKIDVFEGASLRNKSSKFNEFYEGLVHEQFRSDREAARKLYKTSPGDDRYRQLKSRFRKRLLNTLFFINVNTSVKPRFEQAYLDCQRDWALVNILELYDAHISVPYLAKQILSTAQKHHFTELIVSTSGLLLQKAAEEGDRKGFDKYAEVLDAYLPIFQAEQQAERIYQEMVVRSKTVDDDISEGEWKAWTDQLISLSEMHPAPRIQYISYVVAAIQYQQSGRWELAGEICRQAERIMLEYTDQFSADQVFRVQYLLMQTYLHTGSFEEARAQTESALSLLEEGSANWFGYLDLYFLLALHTSHYAIAFAILQQVIQRKEFGKLDEEKRQQWQLYKAILNYLLSIIPEGKRLRQSKLYSDFQVSAFLADPALFPKDQRIFSVWMLITQFLFALEEHNMDLANDIIFRLKQYTRRQLHPERQLRVIEFIRCLTQLPKGDFEANKVRFANKYYHRLLATSYRYDGRMDQLEIIPFHTLWAHIHERLKGTTVALRIS
ncbi:MAG: hypothetical protein K9I85_05370 [Saprospiraceae bacterium]|nr:hypothetical protein [Saprospiraceae bacterium]